MLNQKENRGAASPPPSGLALLLPPPLSRTERSPLPYFLLSTGCKDVWKRNKLDVSILFLISNLVGSSDTHCRESKGRQSGAEEIRSVQMKTPPKGRKGFHSA